MKKICSVVLIFLFAIFSAQYNLKKISFLQKDSITNKNLYLVSLKNEIDKLTPIFKSMYKNFGVGEKSNNEIEEINKKKFDSLSRNFSQKDIVNSSRIYNFEYIDNKILKHWETKENGEILTYPIYLDYNKGKEYYNYPRENEEEYNYAFKKIKNLHLKRIKHKSKIINGLKCIKVIVTYTEIIEAKKYPEFPELNRPEEYIDVSLEMCLTKDIKTLYHPVLNIKEILEKYYPLEIEEKTNSMLGVNRYYKVLEIIKD